MSGDESLLHITLYFSSLIYDFFEFAPSYRGRNPEKFNITSYAGKHILEHHRAEGYMGRQEFEDCMEHLNINTFNNSDYYPIRLKKEYADLWKCH